MENMISIGSQSKEAVEAVGGSVIEIIKIGFDCHMDQKTIQVAIKSFGKALTGNISNVVSNCNFTNNPDKDTKKK